MNIKLKAVFVIISVSLGAVSCVTPLGLTASSTPLVNREIVENLGPSEGRDGSVAVLGLYSIGRPDIDSAIEDALKRKGGQALINVRLYERNLYLLLFTYTEVIVKGDVVRLSGFKREVKGRRR